MHVDKPAATSAATTAFCAAPLEFGGRKLWLDGNGKITAGNGTLDRPKPNAFSLVEIADCPGSTNTCRKACYVHGLAKHAPETHALYVHNSATIRDILAGNSVHAWEWSSVLAGWIRMNAGGGFRWHVSGDVFSGLYAEWIANVCRLSPSVHHWIYTRSFDFVGPLAAVSIERGGNLALNLSCDADNIAEAAATRMVNGGRLCYLTVDGKVPTGLADDSVIFPDYALRGGTDDGRLWFGNLMPGYKAMVCPVDYHGKAENRRCGPCNRCMR